MVICLCLNISEDIQHIVSANQTAAELLSVVSHLLAEYIVFTSGVPIN